MKARGHDMGYPLAHGQHPGDLSSCFRQMKVAIGSLAFWPAF